MLRSDDKLHVDGVEQRLLNEARWITPIIPNYMRAVSLPLQDSLAVFQGLGAAGIGMFYRQRSIQTHFGGFYIVLSRYLSYKSLGIK